MPSEPSQRGREPALDSAPNPGLDSGSAPGLDARIRAAVASLRAQLRERYGWSHVELTAGLDPERRVLLARAEVVSLRLEPALRELLDAQLPDPSWRVELELHALGVARWWAVPGAGLAIWAEHPSRPRPSLATELEPDDSPIAELARDPEARATLVRGRDGTVGWVTHTLDQPAQPRPLTEPAPVEPALGPQILAYARSYLGIPYRLGGATRRHIDCSALIQRALAEVLGALVPRNTRDQLAAAGGGQAELPAQFEPGALIYIHSRRMQRLHVGIASGDGRVVHASRTRDAVVEEPLAAFERDALWMRHVEWEQLREFARAQVGRAHLELPEI